MVRGWTPARPAWRLDIILFLSKKSFDTITRSEFYYNLIYKDLFQKYLIITSPIKVKVCELATGNQYLEVWNALPDSWPYEFATVIENGTVFNKNFVIFETYDDSTDEMDGDMYMILNLVTRKRFSFGKELLEESILSLIDNFDGLSVDMGEYGPGLEQTKVRQMVVGTNQIEIKYHMRISFQRNHYSGQLFIGQSWA